jgi:hypothetical protein
MSERRYKTNLNCGSCVAKVTPHLNAESRIRRWSVDTENPDKVLTVEGDGVGAEAVGKMVEAAGFRVLGEITSQPEPAVRPTPTGPKASYFPIVLLFAFLVLGTGLLEVSAPPFDWRRAMSRFMGGFFLAFAFFKLLDVRAFADAYAGYDVVAGRWRAYGFVYPFLELGLGVAYLSGVWPVVTNAVTLVLMSVGTVGVARTMLAGRKIRCACLGSVFNLPMSYVTLAEDLLMAVMAAVMLATGGHG